MSILREGLMGLYQMKVLNQEQIHKCMEYARRSIFSHLSLYMMCLTQKTETRSKVVTKFHERPELPSMCGDLENECVEIIAPEEAVEVEIHGGSIIEGEEGAVIDEDAPDFVNPDEPMYGL